MSAVVNSFDKLGIEKFELIKMHETQLVSQQNGIIAYTYGDYDNDRIV
jgi:hypothetical protein